MDFSQRSSQPAAAAARSANTNGGTKKNGAWQGSPMWLKILWVVLLFSGTVLVVSTVALLYFGGPKESKIIDKSKFQAVFLTNGQVYFGNVTAANDQFIDLKNIYYLNVNQQVQPEQQNNDQKASVSLVKLGCELHGPADEMIINRDQVTFWENLRTDGEVTKAIDKWVEQNPEGQKCNSTSSLNLDAALKRES